jgi:hypothetical protein
MHGLTSPLAALWAASVLAGCATPALVLDESHPASVTAPEGFSRAKRSTLRADENSRRTRELLAHREQQAEAAEAEPPAPETEINLSVPSPEGRPSSGARTSAKPEHEHH